jgi:hypothetical protein
MAERSEAEKAAILDGLRQAMARRDGRPLTPEELTGWLNTLDQIAGIIRGAPLRTMVLMGEAIGKQHHNSPSFRTTQAFHDLQVALDVIFLELTRSVLDMPLPTPEAPPTPTHSAPERRQ